MITRFATASFFALAAGLMAWGPPAPAAVQIIDHKVTGTLYLINLNLLETESLATALSPDGEVVGYAKTSSTITDGFRGDATTIVNGEVHGLKISEPHINAIRPYGVNAAGLIVGDATASLAGSQPYAFKDDPAIPNMQGGTPVDGPAKELLPPMSAALGVNQGGQIVGFNNQNRAFLYKPDGTFTPLADTPSQARAINDSGTVVGWREVSPGVRQAFVYDGTTTNDLVPGALASEASAINAQGDIAGSITSAQGDEAFLFTAGAPVGLGVAEGFDNSFANGVNAAKWVVGSATGTGERTQTAWLWVEGQLFDLSTQLDWDWVELLPENAPNNANGTGWLELLTATAVGDTGMIVGQGLYQLRKSSRWVQERRAFVLDVDSVPAIPEPGIYLMLLSGLVVIGTVRLRRLGAN